MGLVVGPLIAAESQRVSRSRSVLLSDQPWFGVSAMKLQMEYDVSIETACTDGTRCIWNPVFIRELLDPELLAVLAHEVLHCVLLHMFRRGSRDPLEWNICCDFVVNIILKDAGFRLPKGAYLDEKYRGLTAEQVYAIRQNEKAKQREQQQGQQPSQQGQQSQQGNEKPQQNQQGPQQNQQGSQQPKQEPQGKGQPGPGQKDQPQPGQGSQPGAASLKGTDGQPCRTGEFRDAPPQTEGLDSTEMSEVDWRITAEQATRVALKAGKLPGFIEEAISAQRRRRTDWKAILREFYQQLTPTDQSWARPNRRYLGDDIILPGMTKDNLGPVVWVMDTSGSIGRPIYEVFASEGQRVNQETKPERLIVIFADAKVQAVEEYGPEDDVTLYRKGFGGTRFTPAFNWVEENNIQPCALIYLTDLECHDLPNEPSYPVLWVTPEWVTKEGPFGRTIRLTMDN